MFDRLGRREFVTLLGAATACSTTAGAQTADPRVADLVRAGSIRVGLFLPLYVKDPATGDLRGNLDGVILIKVAQALATRLGVQLELAGYPTPPEAMNAVKAGTCDFGFFGIDPTRAAEADFSPPLVRQEYSYLVPAGSSIRSIADSDRPGVRVAVVRNHASTVTLSRILKQAELVYAETPVPTFDLVRTGNADVMASVRSLLLDFSDKLPGSRVLDDHYGELLLAVALRKGQPGLLTYVSEFVAEAKASGLLKDAIERSGMRGVEVAP